MQVTRRIAAEVLRAARAFPALIVTGPRRAGKTTLLRGLFPRADYRLLEDPDTLGRVRADPRLFIEELRPPAILDEIQNAPELLSYVRTQVDLRPARRGQWLLTGSQEAPLMRGVSESMAGRAAVFHLLPFSLQETPKVSVLRGGFPEVLARPRTAPIWFRSYVQTYLERDVRAVAAIRDLAAFRRFLALLATRVGQILNRSDFAGPLGISVPTVSEWLSILEVTSQIVLVPPFFENFGKRLIKSPKVYFADTGLACHLLGIDGEPMLDRSPFLGPLFENFVATEIVKHQLNAGRARALYYFRDQQGLEVDFVVPLGEDRLALLEAKASRTVGPGDARPLLRLREAVRRYRTSAFVVHRPGRAPPATAALSEGARATVPAGLSLILESGRAKHGTRVAGRAGR
jgi:predicted AAA+ superfamily ATPase